MPSASDRRNPSRKGSADSTGSRKDKRYCDRRNHHDDLGDLVYEFDAKQGATSRDSLPPYQEIEDDRKRPPDEGRGANPETSTGQAGPEPVSSVSASLSPFARLLWPVALLFPLSTTIVLLLLITCSIDSLRPDFCVLQIALARDEYDQISQAAGSISSKQSESTDSSSSGLMTNILRSSDDASNHGYLTLGFWGWCVEDIDAQQ